MDRGIEGFRTSHGARSGASKADLCPAPVSLALCVFFLERYEKRRGVSSAYCWFAIASSFRFEKPLERPIPPLVATASAAGQGRESIEILRGPSGKTGREGSCRRRAETDRRGLAHETSDSRCGHHWIDAWHARVFCVVRAREPRT
jgi:hypothetical protein